jgi:ribonuclease HI
MIKKKIILYTDGSYSKRKPNKGGVGVYSDNLIKIELSELIEKKKNKPVTSQRMELIACIRGITETLEHELYDNNQIMILSDSMYTINSMTKWAYNWEKNNWKKSDKTPVLNIDLIKELFQLTCENNIKYKHIKSHKKEPNNKLSDKWKHWYGNNKADELAKKPIGI